MCAFHAQGCASVVRVLALQNDVLSSAELDPAGSAGVLDWDKAFITFTRVCVSSAALRQPAERLQVR